MCGIIGMVSKDSFSVKDDLLMRLKRLEYRGYDSAGFATREGDLRKRVGEISGLIDVSGKGSTAAAISHTRWATNGGVTVTNAHPHHNKDKTIFAVHNGIIENANQLRRDLESEGYTFISETDSEVVPHFFDNCLKKGLSLQQTAVKFMKSVKGTFAILLLLKGSDEILAMKRDSPLALGLCKHCAILGSDIYAFSDKTQSAYFFEDNEFAIIRADSTQFFDGTGKDITKAPQKFTWSAEPESIQTFDHYMIKEVHEQPVSSKRLIESLKTTQKDKIKKMAEMVKKARRVVFVACGTSYHSSLVGVYLLKTLGIEAHTVIASEFENFLLVDKDTLIIPISQSGETMDVITVLKGIKSQGCGVASVVNVPYSTIQRLSDNSIELLAGQEICVAATKTFTNQVILMLALAQELGYAGNLDNIPGKIQETITAHETHVKLLSKQLVDKKDIFVLGRGLSYPIAREIALKLKEISYIHAEGMMGGELKHGTIALIEEGTPVISLIPNGNADMVSNTHEVEARGAKTIIISNKESNGFHADFVVPSSDNAEFSIYASIIGHLLSYYIAKEKSLPIDKPRNLAKSVTVK